MPPTKILAFMNEFPWAKRLVDKHIINQISRIYVQRMESSILDYRPERIEFIGVFSHHFLFNEKIFLLDETGAMVITEIDVPKKKYLFFGPTILKRWKVFGVVPEASSIGSVIELLGGKADTIQFILSYYEYTETIIVYKLPKKNVSLRQWAKNEIEKERRTEA